MINFTYFIPFSVSNVGSSCKRLLTKNFVLIEGSMSGSSPINFENQRKQASRSAKNTAFSANAIQT